MMITQLILATALMAPGQASKAAIVQPESVMVGGLHSPHHAEPRPVDEQIEVMRALLLRKLSRGPTVAVALSRAWAPGNGEGGMAPTPTPGMGPGFRFGASPFAGVPSSDSSTAPTIEGVYLSGYGVVFTVTMDPPARDPWAKTDVAKAPPTLTEWDRTQRQMRGEPVPEKSASAKKDPPLGEVLLKLLSDNGKHFTALKDDERVILAITFRATTGPIQATPVSANPNVPGMAGMPFATQQPGGAAFAADPAGVRNPEPMIATYDWSHKAEGGASAELLGDMHLKQGQPQKAIEAYVKAVGQAESDAKGLGDDPHHRERISAAYLKLAQAYLAAGNLDEARTAMDQAKAAREKSARPSKPIGKTVAITLPIRLIFSAPKKLLDQVGNGQSTFEDFCKQVTVEYFMDSRNSF